MDKVQKKTAVYAISITVMKVLCFSGVCNHPSSEETKANGVFVASGSIKFYHTMAFLCEKYEIQISKTRLKLHYTENFVL